jgi:hypothetical protein
MNTLQLNLATWDLELDSNGNLAVATGPQAIAQDVASAISTFLGEVYYDVTQGLPWQSEVFGQQFSPSLVGALMEQAALTVPGVVSAKASGLTFSAGKVTGTINFIDTTGASLGVTF